MRWSDTDAFKGFRAKIKANKTNLKEHSGVTEKERKRDQAINLEREENSSSSNSKHVSIAPSWGSIIGCYTVRSFLCAQYWSISHSRLCW